MSTRLKEVSEGSPLVVTHRGKPIALVNAIQGNSPSFGLSEKQAKEFHDLVGTLEAEDFPLLIHFVRKLIEVKVEGNAENEKQK
jgi:antitoxin (DNA-binding transcriptional repressor) of toxin-antitoxin stability system